MNDERRETTGTSSSGRQQVRKARSRRSRLVDAIDEVSPASTPAAWRWTYDLPVGSQRSGR